MLKWLGKALSETNGTPSTMRMIIFIIILSDIINRTYITVIKGTYIPFNWADAITFFGLLYAKQLQKSNGSETSNIENEVKKIKE